MTEKDVYLLFFFFYLKVIPDLRKEINSLQMQRAEADKTMRAQNLQARGTEHTALDCLYVRMTRLKVSLSILMPSAKMSLITRQLLGEAKEEILIQRCAKKYLDCQC